MEDSSVSVAGSGPLPASRLNVLEPLSNTKPLLALCTQASMPVLSHDVECTVEFSW